MRFGLVYYGCEPRDRGLDQLAQSLKQLGHEPFIVSRMFKNGEIVTEFNGTPVIQHPSKGGTFNHLISSPVPFNRLWTRWILKTAQKYAWDGIFVRETPLSLEIQAAARKLNIPTYLDMRENLVAMYAAGSK
ncbi:MAG: glycosyltransferase family 4 protein, partial [bacterium]|nr:glycosyltransferase family 4 protein [bacterium]